MALQVWLPLNKGLNNQGLSEDITIASTAVLSSTGSPIGGCYTFTASQNITISGIDYSKLTNASIGLWVYQDSLKNTVFFTGPSTSHYIFASNSNGTADIYHGNVSGTKKVYVDGVEGVKLGAAGRWHHYVVTGIDISSWSGVLKFNNYSSTYNFAGRVCDIRIYDHALSAKEVKEISKGLMLHYKLNNRDYGTIEYDCSGYGNNGTVVGSPTLVTTGSPRYDGCVEFASNKFIRCGRSTMVRDELTVSLWGYMGTWSYNVRMISCTQSGGWNFEGNASNTGACMEFLVYASGGSAGYVRAADNVMIKNLSSGWHHFVGTYSKYSNQVCYYRDGNFISSATTGSRPIGYHASNGVFVAAESNTTVTTPTTPYFPGRLSDVRIYGTALSPEDVAELYHTAASIDNKGNFYCGELKEV